MSGNPSLWAHPLCRTPRHQGQEQLSLSCPIPARKKDCVQHTKLPSLAGRPCRWSDGETSALHPSLLRKSHLKEKGRTLHRWQNVLVKCSVCKCYMAQEKQTERHELCLSVRLNNQRGNIRLEPKVCAVWSIAFYRITTAKPMPMINNPLYIPTLPN